MLGSSLIAIFVFLALVHVYWACGGRIAWVAAIPEVAGRAAFTPSKPMTFAVAFGLLLCAVLVGATAGIIPLPLPRIVLQWLSMGLALGLLLRAIGDFKLVGFFKRVRDTRFAKLDSYVYVPLCAMLAAAVFFVAWELRTE